LHEIVGRVAQLRASKALHALEESEPACVGQVGDTGQG
jgi:hypothetical protein